MTSDSLITAFAPRGHGSVPIRVVTASGISQITPSDYFTYQPSPPRAFCAKWVKPHIKRMCKDVGIRLTWKKSSTGHPVCYKIYRDLLMTQLIAIVPADCPLNFLDKCPTFRHHIQIYTIVGVDALGVSSHAVSVSVKKKGN